MPSKLITPEIFQELLPGFCNKETSADADGWTPENPLWGHCAVVSLVAQNLFGGELLRGSLEGTPFSAMRSHYWNQLPDSTEIDFSEPQFGDRYPQELMGEVKERSYVLSYEPTVRRYKLLAWRLAQALFPDNPLFADPIYQRCFYRALDPGCQKMWFGCVVMHNGEIICETTNKPIEPLKHVCDPVCVRFKVQSRTESFLGACGHAEEFALQELIGKGIPLKECSFYIAGLYTTGMPWIKKAAEFTCIRCATQLHLYGVGKIYVPTVDHWEEAPVEESVRVAYAYAMGEKEV